MVVLIIIIALYVTAAHAASLSSANPFKPKLPKVKKEEVPQDINNYPPLNQNDYYNRYTSDDQRRATIQTQTQGERKEEEPEMPTLTVTGLVWNSNRPQAIINETVVNVGDTLEDVKITAIHKGGVDVEFYGKTSTISPETNSQKEQNQ